MALKGKSVLIVEDAADVRLRYRAILENQGLQVFEAASIEESIGILSHKHPHLIILDLQLPGKSGFDFLLARRTTPAWATIPVIVSSTMNSREPIQKAVGLGANDYVVKPVNTALFLQRVRKQLRDQSSKVYTVPPGPASEASILVWAQITRVLPTHWVLESPVRLAECHAVALAAETGEQLGIGNPVLATSRFPGVRQVSGNYLTEITAAALRQTLPGHSKRSIQEARPPGKSERPRLFAIGEDAQFGSIVQNLLKKFGIDVESFQDLKAVLHWEVKTVPDFCLVQSVDLIEPLRKKFGAALPIFFVSPDENRDAVRAAIRGGADDVLLKPLDRDVFLSKVSAYFRTPDLDADVLTSADPVKVDVSTVLELEARLLEIDENGLLISSRHWVNKDSVLKITGKTLQESIGRAEPILAKVNSTSFDSSSASYQVELEYDLISEETRGRIRDWIARNEKKQASA